MPEATPSAPPPVTPASPAPSAAALSDGWRWPWPVARVFLLLALLGGTAYALLVPPFQPADEGTHLQRAWQVSEGGWLAEPGGPEPGSRQGGWLPSSLPAVQAPYKLLFFHSDGHLPPGTNARAWAQPLAPQERSYVEFPNVARYPPVFYLPAVVGVWLARLAGGPVLLALYLARLADVLAYALLGWLALRWLPLRQWGMFWLLLLPMPLSLAGTVTLDGPVIGVCACYLALCLRAAQTPTAQLARGERRWLWGLGALMALAKFAYAPLLLLYFLVPRSRWPSRRAYWRETLAYFTVGGILFLGWAWLVRHMQALPGPGVVVSEQLAWMTQHPLGYAAVLVNTVAEEPLRLLYSLVGLLGHTDTPITTMHFLSALFLLVLATLADEADAPVLPLVTRGGLVALSLLPMLILCTLLYLTWTPVGATTVHGLVGRYFLPTAPLLVVAASNRLFLLTRPAPVRTFYAVAALASTLWALLAIWQRYYGG